MSQNIYALLTDDQTSALISQVKAHVAIKIVQCVRASGKTQNELAHMAKISQPRMSNIMQGLLHKFSLEALLEIAHRIGIPVSNSFDGKKQTLQIG
ncbi:helix-turn-helix motif domain protein [Stenotrophomonas phage C121]|uniref:helix-turn-helix motif domain protein n=1 Tax=Stenotrophomonas phage C121 TaxID=2914029 RepID=UPI0023292CEE|nr:helix-turn-helix motif domain protein [Stenotrophomonas phage C121]UKL14794.1 helix-turn-helix motif domain protein [Stenotrophomonas phage C121]